MTKCEHCGATILFGPVREGTHKFCSKECRYLGVQAIGHAELPDGYVAEKVYAVFAGTCPKCDGEGPVDVYKTHWIWSAGIITSYKSTPEICCRRCGRKNRVKAILFNALFGWWGIPWGIFGTPIQILRNLDRLGPPKGQTEPTDTLVEMVRADLAMRLIASSPMTSHKSFSESKE